MRVVAVRLSRATVCAVALVGVISGIGPATAEKNAAHSLAEKFSRAADDAERKAQEAKRQEAERARAAVAAAQARREAEAQREADEANEADMLRRARAEAKARRATELHAAQERAKAAQRARQAEAARRTREAEDKRLAEERQAADKAQRAQAARRASEAEDKRLAEEREATQKAQRAQAARRASEAEDKRLAEEREATQKAQRAEAARRAKEANEKRLAAERKSAEARRAESARRAKLAEARRLAEQRAAKEAQRVKEARAALEARRLEEAQRVIEKFRLAREARMRKAPSKNSLGGPRPPAAKTPNLFGNRERDPMQANRLPSRVTVLLVMEPRRNGLRRYRRTADPILCVGKGCYVSAGPEDSADYFARWKALGPGIALGRRAGACRHQLTCAFRDVELGATAASIQPVDLGYLRHSRRQVERVQPDRTCDVVQGRLHCAATVITDSYRAWIIPEAIAAKAGPDALEDALDDGLTASRSAALEEW